MSKLDVAIFDLSNALAEEGVKLEFIKIDKPISNNNKTVYSIGGIEIKTVIYEDDATAWRSTHDNTSRPLETDIDKPRDMNEWYLRFVKETDVIKKFNLFIEWFCPDDFAHLIDSDDNPGQEMRNAIYKYALQRFREAEIAIEKRYHKELNYYKNLFELSVRKEELKTDTSIVLCGACSAELTKKREDQQ